MAVSLAPNVYYEEVLVKYMQLVSSVHGNDCLHEMASYDIFNGNEEAFLRLLAQEIAKSNHKLKPKHRRSTSMELYEACVVEMDSKNVMKEILVGNTLLLAFSEDEAKNQIAVDNAEILKGKKTKSIVRLFEG